MSSSIDEAERELEKVEEVLAMADRVIQISRQEQERIAADLPSAASDLAASEAPAVEAG